MDNTIEVGGIELILGRSGAKSAGITQELRMLSGSGLEAWYHIIMRNVDCEIAREEEFVGGGGKRLPLVDARVSSFPNRQSVSEWPAKWSTATRENPKGRQYVRKQSSSANRA